MKKDSGFSLVELMIVIVIIGLMSIFIAPNIMSWRPGQDLRASAQMLNGSLQRAKVAAIKDNENMTIGITATIPCPSGFYLFSNTQTTISGCVGDSGSGRTTDVGISAAGLPVDIVFTSRGLVQTSGGAPLGAAASVVLVGANHNSAGNTQYTVTVTTAGGVTMDKGSIP
ncbi:MAG: prepilin-type N-terminal cleavage/methylation domain-containing protein [Desulfotalea sp.]